MPGNNGLEVNRLVRIALSALPPGQRTAVDRVLRSPRAFASLVAEPANVQAIATRDPQLYTVRVTPRLRLVYEETEDGFRVVDLVDQATLEHFAAAKAKTGPSRGLKGRSGTPEVSSSGAIVRSPTMRSPKSSKNEDAGKD